ncbi:hypothetical protein [Williamsoniiplasma luminosum]|uniref:Uncharacterized protein n=1 Tax=Williamsoniiplasma luminosum TaxID=214888 RepID=A0A2S0NL63_9MOLU|nr:hypothetical protein [Williamsoniiplasma luminosum]AVP49748.1 MAG: hypothetical protein C5T88_04215 [Williamsoniiplasma luminosum]
MKKFKIISIIFLFIWIMLWGLFTALLVWATDVQPLWVLMLFAIVAVFNLVWWVLIADDKKELGMFTKFCFLFTLNFPAFIFAKLYRQQKVEQENEEIAKKKIIDPELDNEYDFIPEWEKAIIAQKTPKKEKQPKKISAYLENPDFVLQRKIINAYCQYLLFLVLSEEQTLTDTFEMTTRVSNKAYADNQEEQFRNFLKVFDLFLPDNFHKTNEELKMEIMKTLNDTTPAEVMVLYKENRIENTINVKQKLKWI